MEKRPDSCYIVCMKRAAIYCRVSTDSQEESGSSLQSQTDACRKHAESLGYEIADTFSDTFSGAYLTERPQLSRLRDAVKAREIDCVVVYALDRLSREMAHLYILLDEFTKRGVELAIVSEQFDSSAEGKLLQSVRGYVAEVERVKIRERTMRGRHTKALNGTIKHDRSIYGYIVTSQGRELCPTTSHVVREMFVRMIDGGSLRSISADLTTRGIVTPQGKNVWYAHSVAHILKNPVYCGKPVMFRYQHEVKYDSNDVRRENGSKQRDKSEWVELPPVTPIVSEDEFNLVQARLEHNKKAKRGRPKHEALLRGLVRCARCGRQMSPWISKSYPSYVCTSKQSPVLNCGVKMMNARLAETLVWNKIEGFLREPERLHEIIRNAQTDQKHRRDDLKDELASLDKQITNSEAEVSRLTQRLALADDRLFVEMNRMAGAKLDELERLRSLRIDILKEHHSRSATSDGIDAILRRGKRTIDRMPFADRVDLLNALGLQCKWDGERLKASIGTQYGCQSTSERFNNNTVQLPL